jgi:hypothetical protein
MLKLAFQGKIQVVFFKEDDAIIACAPALDLSSCGSTFKEAKKNFSECLHIYLRETIRRGTLEQDLMRLGWTVSPGEMSLRPPKEEHKNIPLHILKTENMRIPIGC